MRCVSWRLLLGLSAGLLGCQAEVLSWPELKVEIRSKWPDVPTLTPTGLARRIGRNEAILLVDVREPAEYEVSRLPGAVNLPEGEELAERILAQLEPLPEVQDVVVYCSVGYRSARAAHEIGSLPGKTLYNLEGSIFEWANEGRALEGPRGTATVVHPCDERWGLLLDPRYRAKLP